MLQYISGKSLTEQETATLWIFLLIYKIIIEKKSDERRANKEATNVEYRENNLAKDVN